MGGSKPDEEGAILFFGTIVGLGVGLIVAGLSSLIVGVGAGLLAWLAGVIIGSRLAQTEFRRKD